ncbi:MAG: tagatose 1,6-diphosphate aldolase [Dehalococcoides mccartyi]|uniref:tagatose 1,6-diphosphate aldolase n=1 Tax=Dehalococcoides mccartyi TaxID=61435 RepID=UPI0030F58660
MTISAGKLLNLTALASQRGLFEIAAMDHRGSIKKHLCPKTTEEECYHSLADFKLSLCRAFSGQASAVLLDPIYGLPECLAQNAIAPGCGLLVSLESSGYGGEAEYRTTELLKNWGVNKIKLLGANAVKLLLYYRPDIKDLAKTQQLLVKTVADECRKLDIPFVLEPVTYPTGQELKNAGLFAKNKPGLVLSTVEDLAELGIDILKVEFPADLRFSLTEDEAFISARKLDSICPVPWAILSAGADFNLYVRELEIACQCGASGFLAGRAVWQEALEITNPVNRQDFINRVAAERFKRLCQIAENTGRPWHEKLGLKAGNFINPGPTWYANYQPGENP